MRRDGTDAATRRARILAALRALPDAAAERRARIVASLRALPGGGLRAQAARALAAVRRRPDALLGVLLGAGVLAMILHWR